MSLSGKNAVVTGGAAGIGRAIVQRLAREQVGVGILDLDVDRGLALATEIQRDGGRALAVRSDVADADSVTKAFERFRTELGDVSILVNNAGIAELVTFPEMSEAQWDRTIAVHLKGVFHCTQAVVKTMCEAGWGRIVSISSVAALSGAPGFVHYAAAKGGIIGFTKALALEVASTGVTVNAIAPGVVDTALLRKAGLDEETIATFGRQSPVHRIGQPADIAAACAYIVSEDAGFLTGQVISPNGGVYPCS